MGLQARRRANRKLGWIGVDIGTSTIKVAQVARSKQGWRVAAAAVVPRQQSWQNAWSEGTETVSTCNEFQVAQSLQHGYRGRSVAATLPMLLCDVHRLDRDLSCEPNAQQLLRQVIETAIQQSSEHLQCDYWSAPVIESKPAWSQALTVSRGWTDQLCEDIAQVGWHCEAIDGLPQAMARAVGMVHSDSSTAPVAALDWGSGRATLCFIEQGQPAYVRCLKDCGLRNMLDALVEKLQVTDLEAQRLLEEYGIASPPSEETRGIARLVQETIAESLGHLVEEMKRSCSHYQGVRRGAGPQQLYLLGGGAMIGELGPYLTTQLNLEARPWQLPTPGASATGSDTRENCLLAPAIALSALAWEAS